MGGIKTRRKVIGRGGKLFGTQKGFPYGKRKNEGGSECGKKASRTVEERANKSRKDSLGGVLMP